jgi:hypothetical protein
LPSARAGRAIVNGFSWGRYHATVATNHIAPTLATLLGVETPRRSQGRALAEMPMR